MIVISFCLASMLLYSVAELIGKKAIIQDDGYSIIKMRIVAIFSGAVLLIIAMALGLGESKMMPWEIVINNPLLIVTALTSLLSEFFYLYALKYIGLAIEDSLIGFGSVLLFIGMIVVNAISGVIGNIKEMLIPLRFIPILIFIVGVVVLPNTEGLGRKIKDESIKEQFKKNYKKMIIGILFIVLGAIFDATDSLIFTIILTENTTGTVDVFLGSYFIAFVIGVILYVWLWIRTKKPFIPFSKKDVSSSLQGLLFTIATIVFFIGASFDAVRMNIISIVYPIVPMIGAFVIFKERYTWKQYVCMGVVMSSSIAFCLIDLLI